VNPVDLVGLMVEDRPIAASVPTQSKATQKKKFWEEVMAYFNFR
jgi:hypothetical protein